MFKVFECVAEQHDSWLVLVGAVICVFGNIGLFVLLRRARTCIQARRGHWLLIAAVVAGVTVWATHFIAMLAYDGPMPMAFDVKLTVLSVIVAIAFFRATFQALGRRPTRLRCFVAGAGAGLGATAMHFIGISSIIAPARLEFDYGAIAASLAVSCLLFGGAFLAFSAKRAMTRALLPVIFAVLAIFVLHFAAMAGTSLVPDATQPVDAVDAMSIERLAAAVVAASFLLIVLSVIGALVDRWLTDARGLANATLEGVAIVSNGKIVEANRQLRDLLGAAESALIGSAPSDWLSLIDGRPFALSDAQTVEARLRGSVDEDQVFEVATHTIEYRGRPCEVLAVRDLTDRRRAQRAIEHLASHDALTDLANRANLVRSLEAAIASDRPFALLAVDLDRFKAVNNVFGHGAGDEILRRVAAILRAAVRRGDVVARVGADDFLIVQHTDSPAEDARALTNRILQAFATEMDMARDPMGVCASIGVALYPQDGADAETLQRNADIALHRAKSIGRGNASFFDQEMDKVAQQRRMLEIDLRQAIARKQLRLVFQPLVATAFNSVIGYEALLRWDHPDRGEIAPDCFIPLAEEIGAIVPIGEWVLREACRIAAKWPSGLSIAVNVSTVQFDVPTLPQIVGDALDQSGLAAHRLELEVTETVFMRSRENTLKSLHEIRAMGVRIAMDDFGTGYSSLSNLQSFPFDKIKIDKSFVAAISNDAAARLIVRAIIGLGRTFNTPIVAEGVETEEQRQLILDEGCPQAQGYYFGKPVADPFGAEHAAAATLVER